MLKQVPTSIDKTYAAIFPLGHGASSDLDEAAYMPPAKTCFMAMLQRSGSNMLCVMLEQTGALGYPGEYLSPRGPMQLYRDRYKSRNFLEYMNSVVSSRRTPNGVFALKTTYGDFNPIESSSVAGKLFPNAKFIYLIRKNIVAQAISAQKAKTSGLWHKRANGSLMGSAQTATPQYDKASILNIIRGLVRDQQDWELFFLLHKINPLRITYEELCENPYRVLEDVISFLGVEPAVSPKSITVPTMRLADDTNRQWEERFLSEFSL